MKAVFKSMELSAIMTDDPVRVIDVSLRCGSTHLFGFHRAMEKHMGLSHVSAAMLIFFPTSE